MSYEHLGFIAGALTTLSSLPQVIRTWRTKKTKDLSLGAYLMVFMGVILWLIYGLSLNDWPLIASNAIGLIFISIVLSFKLRYG